jgi:putative transposase
LRNAARYPSFKKKEGRQAAEYTRSGFKFEIGNQRLLIARLGPLKVKWSRHVSVKPTTVTLIRKPSGRHFVSLVVEVLIPRHCQKPDKRLVSTLA